jgi:ATP-dependent protease ClpP protease subunit
MKCVNEHEKDSSERRRGDARLRLQGNTKCTRTEAAQPLARNAKKGEFRAEGNTIYLYDVIVSTKEEAEWFGGVDAETFVQTLKGMSGDVSLRINSPGGDVFAARAMAQAIREHDGKVTAHVDGYAASAASFVTSVADETVDGARRSMLMIHKAWSIALGNSDDFMATRPRCWRRSTARLPRPTPPPPQARQGWRGLRGADGCGNVADRRRSH